MEWKRNYHTHTRFCDGQNTPEEVAAAAFEAGMVSLGFSGHSHTAFDESYCMSHEAAREYRERILALRDQYAGRMEILCGLEYDYYSDESKDGWDYRIGSVHYVEKDGDFIPVDESAAVTEGAVRNHYDGDIYAFAEDFFRLEGDVVRKTGCDIIGHFDLIKKFNRKGVTLLDEQNPRYRAAWQQAVRELVPYGVPFEINTTPMSWRADGDPYPSREILEEIHRLGGKITISTDSHQVEMLQRGVHEALALAKEIGFTELVAMSPDGAKTLEIG